MKYTVIGTKWLDEYEEKLFYTATVDNPNFKPSHWSCAHLDQFDEETKKGMWDRNDYCTTCGRRVRWVKHKQQVLVKKPFSWVTRYSGSPTSLILTNPWNLQEYTVEFDKNASRLWLIGLSWPHDDYTIDELATEDLLAFKTFISRFFGTTDVYITNIQF